MVSYSYKQEKGLNYQRVCQHCGQSNSSDNYNCKCNHEWSDRYRSLDLQINTGKYREEAIRSFTDYSFSNPDGMMQYNMLPGQEYFNGYRPTVGLTPLCRLKSFSRQYGSRIYMKNEGGNPSDCFKDRETLMCLLNSRRKGLNKAAIFSSGNAAASAALLAEQEKNFDLLTFVSGDTYPEKIDFIRDKGSDVVIMGDQETNYETGYRLFSKMNAQNLFAEMDCDNWTVQNPYRVQGDKTTALEIIKQLSAATSHLIVPNYIVVPTANGSNLTGIWKGFKELYQLDIITRLPKMISAGIENANPVNQAVQQKRINSPIQCDLSNVNPQDTSAGSTLLAEEGYDSMEAAKAVLESGGFAVPLHMNDVKTAYLNYIEGERELFHHRSFLPEPAAMLPIAALDKIKAKASLTAADTVVTVATGCAIKAAKTVNDLLAEYPDLQKKANQCTRRRKRGTKNAANRGEKVRVEASIPALKQAIAKLQRAHV